MGEKAIAIKSRADMADELAEALRELFKLANHFEVRGVYFTEYSVNREACEQAESALAKYESMKEALRGR